MAVTDKAGRYVPGSSLFAGTASAIEDSSVMRPLCRELRLLCRKYKRRALIAELCHC
jgi:hypothetical protein